MDPSDFGEGLTKLGDTYAPPPKKDSPMMCPACPLNHQFNRQWYILLKYSVGRV